MSAVALTQGNIRPQLISLAVPLLAGNILQQLYNTIDAVLVGHFVGQEAFAAVGVSGSVMNLFLFLISGSCSGVGVLLGQFFGAKDHNHFRQNFYLATVFGSALSLLLTTIGLCVLPTLLALLQTPQELLPYAMAYLRVIDLGFIAAFAFHLGAAVLRSVGNTQAALLFLMVSMITNMVLDVVFLAKFSWGVAGAAWATVIAQTLAAILCVGYLYLYAPILLFHRSDMVLDMSLLRRTAHYSLVTALQMCSLYIGKLLVQGTVNSLGTDAIAAFTAATRIEGFANSFGDSGASSVSVFIGQNTGAKNYARVKKGFLTGEALLLGFGVVMSLLMILGAIPCLKLVLPQENQGSLAPAVGYLRLVAYFYVFNFMGSGLSGYFHGRGKVHLPVMGTTGHISIRVVLSLLLASRMGLPAVALASGLGWVAVNLFWCLFVIRDFRTLEAR